MKSTIEIWRNIKDYEGLYQVSNLGRVRSVDRYVKHNWGGLRLYKGRILKPQLNKFGYLTVGLCKENKLKYYRINRLVAEAFIPNLDNLPTVDHINRDRTDNRLENLRWAPYKLQAKNRIVPIQTNRIDLSKPVLQYTLDMVFVMEYPSVSEASRQTGISTADICRCCNGKRKCKSAGGYKWVYK